MLFVSNHVKYLIIRTWKKYANKISHCLMCITMVKNCWIKRYIYIIRFKTSFMYNKCVRDLSKLSTIAVHIQFSVRYHQDLMVHPIVKVLYWAWLVTDINYNAHFGYHD